MSTSNQLNIVQRVLAPTPSFFKKVRNTGLALTAVSASLLAAHELLPELIVKIAGYATVAGGVLSAISQTTVEDNAKHQEELYE